MELLKQWVALLDEDEDEDDYLFWQYGFNEWADHLDLRWFHSVNAFLSATHLGQSKPAVLVLDGVVPRGEEAKWISTLMHHASSKQARIIMLSEEMVPQHHQTYMNLGVADHLIKPSSKQMLKEVVMKVSSHVVTNL